MTISNYKTGFIRATGVLATNKRSQNLQAGHMITLRNMKKLNLTDIFWENHKKTLWFLSNWPFSQKIFRAISTLPLWRMLYHMDDN